jgi:hypothetical protein
MDGYVGPVGLLVETLTSPFSLSGGIRRSAFEKLAALAVKSPAHDDGSELARLAKQSRTRQSDGGLNGVLKDQAPTSRVPMVSCQLHVALSDVIIIDSCIGYSRTRCPFGSM